MWCVFNTVLYVNYTVWVGVRATACSQWQDRHLSTNYNRYTTALNRVTALLELLNLAYQNSLVGTP